jgi:hypothetical protein
MVDENEEFVEEYQEKTEPVTIPEEDDVEEVDEFDLNDLIIKGDEAVQKRKVDFFDLKSGKIKRMPIYVKPITHDTWEQIARSVTKKNGKSIEQLICATSLVEADGMEIPISTIKKMQKGFVAAAYEEIKIVSGITKDVFQEKMLEQMSPF